MLSTSQIHSSTNQIAIPIGIVKESDRLAMTMAWLTLRALIVDTVELVSREITISLKEKAISPSEVVRKSANDKQIALKRWAKAPNPLSYKEENGNINENMKLLIFFLANNAEDVRRGLPLHNDKSISYKDLGKSLYNMGKNNLSRSHYPVDSKGYCLSVLRITIQLLKRSQQIPNEEDYFSTLFAVCAERMNINFIPWASTSQNGNGRHRTSPSSNIWMMLAHANGQPRLQAPRIQSEEELAEETANQITLDDPNADWSINAKLDNLATLLTTKTCLPSNWSPTAIEFNDPNDYVGRSYQFVDNNYIGSNWKHRMALIWAVLFSFAKPNLFYDSTVAQKLKAIKGDTIAEEIRSLDWVPIKGKKGVFDQSQLMSMMLTYIIGIMDPNSPLRKQVEDGSGFGKSWTEKHSKRFLQQPSFIQVAYNYFKARKGINPVNLIRMGIATTKTGGVLNATRFESSWNIRVDDDLKILYEAVISRMVERPYGMWDALCLIFGNEFANTMAEKGQCVARNLPRQVICGPSSPSKRRKRDNAGEDSDSENGSPTKRRH
jgi:hypothetical protein